MNGEPLYDLDKKTWTSTCPCVLSEQLDPDCEWHGREARYNCVELERAIGEVLFNVNNYPERAQSRLLGSDFSKLKNKLITAVLAAGFRRVVEK